MKMNNTHKYITNSKKGSLTKAPLKLESLDPNKVRVKISYVSIARGDIHMIDCDWGAKFKEGLTPGHEAIGEIIDIGQDVPKSYLGKKVGLGYQQSACFRCETCISGLEQFCEYQKVAFYDDQGYLASHVDIDYRFCFQIDDRLFNPQFVPMFSSGLTVFSAIKRANLKPGSRVAIFGFGGLGHIAAQILKAMGHEVSVISHQEDKKAYADKLKIDNFISYKGVKKMLDIEIDRKFDFVISTVNVEFDAEKIISFLKPQGSLAVVGLPQSLIKISPTSLADYAQKMVYGSYIGSIGDMKDLINFSLENNIQPIIEECSGPITPEILDRIRDMKVRFRLILKL